MKLSSSPKILNSLFFKVFFTAKASLSIISLADYISDEIKMPLTASRYADKMGAFGLLLGVNPFAWPVCSSSLYKSKNYHCAVFDKKWVFVYSITNNRVIIQDVIHGKLIKE